jgi:hypothetical protein
VGLDRPHGEVFQDVLLISRGPAMAGFVLPQARQRKKSKEACPAKSINLPGLGDLPSWKSAP